MGEMLPAFLSYVFVTTFTPGPNNVSSASMGITYGYRKTLRYIAGITFGFALIMFACGLLTESVIRFFPTLESVLRYAGAGYMIYLAVMILRASTHHAEEPDRNLATFTRGALLQIVNPKVIVYGITVFSGFLLGVIAHTWQLAVAAVLLSSFAFVSTSLWAIFGAALKRYFAGRIFTLVFNSVMALLLLYSAAVIAGLI
jgi:cysteine/O-acetylserine efflux protein